MGAARVELFGRTGRYVATGEPIIGTPTVRVCELQSAAREDVRQRGNLAAVLPGDGTEHASPEDVACVSWITGRDMAAIALGHGIRPNVALLRSQLRRWAVRESCGLRPTDGAA